MKHIPNFITSLNLVSGFLAIISAMTGNTVIASWLIVAAMIFDFLDGFSARLLNSWSETGKELDSLADVVSFGVAPALILYQMITGAFGQPDQPALNAGLLRYVTVLMPACAALRLAKFNIDSTQKYSFKGLPTPANAIAVISIVIAVHYSGSGAAGSFAGSPVMLTAYTVVLSILMVTNIPLISLKVSNLKFRGNEGRYILIALVLVSFALFGFAAAPLIIPFYILASFAGRLFREVPS